MSYVYHKGVHRTCLKNNLKPIENTLPAFITAITKKKAKYLECDCRISKDNIIVIWHDETVGMYAKRSWNKNKKIRNLKWNSISSIALKEDYKITSLHHLILELDKHKLNYVKLVLDIKTVDTAIELAKLLTASQKYRNRVELVISYSQDILFYFYKNAGLVVKENVKSAWILDSIEYPDDLKIPGETMINYNDINKFFTSYIKHNLLFTEYNIGLYLQFNKDLTSNVVNKIKNNMLSYKIKAGCSILGLWNDISIFCNYEYFNMTQNNINKTINNFDTNIDLNIMDIKTETGSRENLFATITKKHRLKSNSTTSKSFSNPNLFIDNWINHFEYVNIDA